MNVWFPYVVCLILVYGGDTPKESSRMSTPDRGQKVRNFVRRNRNRSGFRGFSEQFHARPRLAREHEPMLRLNPRQEIPQEGAGEERKFISSPAAWQVARNAQKNRQIKKFQFEKNILDREEQHQKHGIFLKSEDVAVPGLKSRPMDEHRRPYPYRIFLPDIDRPGMGDYVDLSPPRERPDTKNVLPQIPKTSRGHSRHISSVQVKVTHASQEREASSSDFNSRVSSPVGDKAELVANQDSSETHSRQLKDDDFAQYMEEIRLLERSGTQIMPTDQSITDSSFNRNLNDRDSQWLRSPTTWRSSKPKVKLGHYHPGMYEPPKRNAVAKRRRELPVASSVSPIRNPAVVMKRRREYAEKIMARNKVRYSKKHLVANQALVNVRGNKKRDISESRKISKILSKPVDISHVNAIANDVLERISKL